MPLKWIEATYDNLKMTLDCSEELTKWHFAQYKILLVTKV